jgi:hypothetical protein
MRNAFKENMMKVDRTSGKKSEAKDVQTTKPNDTQCFPLFGHTLAIPRELENYNVFYTKYDKMADKIHDVFPSEYKEKFNSIEQVLDGYMRLYEKHLFATINVAVEDLIQNKVFDVDFDVFLKRHSKRLRVFNTYEKLEAQFEEIIEDEAAKNAYRAARRQNRGRWSGGGFGYVVGLILVPGFILYILLFSRKKEKKLWNEVTHGGQYDLADITQQQVEVIQ